MDGHSRSSATQTIELMKTLHIVSLTLLFTILFAPSASAAEAKVDPNLKTGQAALRAKEYKLAVAALDKAIAAKGKRVDEARYLKALAQYHGKLYDDCIATLGRLAEAHPKSAWLHKGRVPLS